MASLGADNLELPQLMADIVVAAFPTKSALIGTGAVRIDPNPIIAEGGHTWAARDLALYTGRPVADDGTTHTPVTGSARKYIAPVYRKILPIGTEYNVLAAIGAGQLSALYAAHQAQAAATVPFEIDSCLLDIVKGLFDPSAGVLKDSNKVVEGSASGTMKLFKTSSLIAGKLKLGDRGGDLRIIAMHSKVWADVQQNEIARCSDNAIVTFPDGTTMQMPTYMGNPVYVSDQLPVTSDTNPLYTTLLLGPGAFTVGFQRNVELRPGYDVAKNADILNLCFSYSPSLIGVSWTGTAADLKGGPTNIETYTATNYTKVGTTKEIKAVAIVTN